VSLFLGNESERFKYYLLGVKLRRKTKMTVISAMKFNDEEGAIVADEQATYGGRKLKFVDKVYTLIDDAGMNAVIGSSGLIDFAYEGIVKRLLVNIGPHRDRLQSGFDLARVVGECMDDVKQGYIAGAVQSRFGISDHEFKMRQRKFGEGMVPIPQEDVAEYKQYREGVNNEIKVCCDLVLVRDERGIEIYITGMENSMPVPTSRPFRCIGSGQDMADECLVAWFDRMKREERKNVNPVLGLARLLYATERASVRNMGVGGTPTISVISKTDEGHKIIIPSETSSLLAAELVKGESAGYLPQEFMIESLDKLVFKGEDPLDVEKAMWEATTYQRQFSRFLRGYKV